MANKEIKGANYEQLVKARPELFDYPDVPARADLSPEYEDAVTPDHIKERRARRARKHAAE